MPAAPVVESITFDKASYIKGQKITATVNYAAGLSDLTQTFTGQATDQTTQAVGLLTASFVISNAVTDPTTAAGADTGKRTWTKVSDGQGTAVFTATA